MPRDLFKPVVPANLLNPLFVRVMDDPGHSAARTLINEVFAYFRDVDGSFVREFQTRGFSPRIFELALFAYMEEQDLDLDRTHPAPDFVTRGDNPVAIEVTTTNPTEGVPLDLGPVLVENSVTGSGLDFHAAGRYSLSSPPRHCQPRIVSIRTGDGIIFGSSSGARRRIPSPWWLRAVLWWAT